MFDRIAHRYDFLNRILSVRRDVSWRRKAVQLIAGPEFQRVLDLATGTGDLLLTAAERSRFLRHGVGVDPAKKMLQLARRKATSLHPETPIDFLIADGLTLPFADQTFDAVTIAFGIRNIEPVPSVLEEIIRVLRPGGRLVVLEFSLPKAVLIRSGYLFYFRNILPKVGGWLSGDGLAYRYLNRTVEEFPYGEAFCGYLRRAGFAGVGQISLSFGIATIYYGDKHDR